ncbi:unnamed protein product [Tilletia laevis]|uniref:Uncharacterized protein n=3 Tax=Tilletia TaxID=13289 RepID=A0A8X7N2D4_9BASI|nr:hypothetical protein CF336_g54 [Tilletia laevis]KAE8206221.1 hypothetical protein CF328_g40 [Tilletia controversa]CAD6945297.1 unnamed protein product [Tilletia caries]KAE8256218.1 hypothetical protein A4X06_0g10 [Tilletia controversa]CAD6898610.1 unnamed protein product [Tilletia laevis]
MASPSYLLDQRNSSRLSNDWASYVHLHSQLEESEPDPSIIVVKKPSVTVSASASALAPPAPASRGAESTSVEYESVDSAYSTYSSHSTVDASMPVPAAVARQPASALDARLARDPDAGDRRSAVTTHSALTDDMSEYGEDDVVLYNATRVGLHRSPSSGAAVVFNRSTQSSEGRDREVAVKRSSSHRSNQDHSVDAPTHPNAGTADGPASTRTSIGEDRNRNSIPSRVSIGTSGWQTPSESQSQHSPRSSRSVRPLTLPPAEPLPPLPSPNSNTPQLPFEGGGAMSSPEHPTHVLHHSSSVGRLRQGTNSGGHLPSSTSTPAIAPRTTSRDLGFETRSPPQTGAAISPANRDRPGTGTSSGSYINAEISSTEQRFMDRIDRPAQSVTSSSSISSAATPAHLRPGSNAAKRRMNGDSSSTVTSPVTPTAATMAPMSPSTSAALPTTNKPTDRAPPSAAGKAAVVKAKKSGPVTASPATLRANPLAGARAAASEQLHENRAPLIIGPGGRTMTRRASEINIQSRRTEMEEDKSIVKVAPQERSVILKKAETRFAGAFTEVAQAFKQLQSEKRTLENIIRATTPLDGLGDQGQLAEYLKSMTAKIASSEEEIRKLLELLDQQRAVMDYMLETHERESDAHFDQIDELHAQLDSLAEESEVHRANCVHLTAELDRAHNEAVAARSDVLKLRAAVQQESSKCEQAMTLLRAVQHQMKDRDQMSKALRTEVDTLRAREADQKHARGADEDMQANLSGHNAKELSSMSDELRRTLSSQHEADLLSRSEQIRSELATKHAREFADYKRQLRTELATQHKSEIKALKQKLESSLILSEAEAEQRLSSTNITHDTEVKMLQARLAKLEREGDSKATLEAELRERKTQHVTLVGQLAERTNAMNEMEQKSRALEKEVDTLRTAPAPAPPPLSEKDMGLSGSALQARLQAAEARANAAERAKEQLNSKLTALEEGGSKSELASLRAQLVDQRSREVQIRNAYKNLQYELRKAQQTTKADERRRTFLTGNVGGGSTSASVSGHGGSGGPASPTDGVPGLHRSNSNSSQTSRQLKRLSLPIVSKGDRILSANWMDTYQRENGNGGGGSGSGTASRPTSSPSFPPSSFRQPLSASANRTSFSTSPSPSDRRQSQMTDGGAGDEDGRNSATGTASLAGHGSSTGGVLGYGSSAISNVMGMSGMNTSTGSSMGGNYSIMANQHGGRPLSEASAYSIEEGEEEDDPLELVTSDSNYSQM